MVDFAKLKKNRKSNLANLQQKMEETASGKQKSNRDDRFWSPTVDKAGNGYAVLRFLPPQEGDLPWVRLWSHGFKGEKTGQWYIENSRTTIEEDDPVAEYNSELWNSGVEEDKEQARKQKRRLHFISNVLIVKDDANPELEGKVMLFKYGKKIFEKLNAAMNPEFEDEEAMDPFDMWEGANFRLKIRKYEGYRNYDKSDFAEPSAVADDDKAIKAIWEQTHDIQALVAPDQFKSYAELKARLERVLNLKSKTRIVEEANETEEETMDAPEEKEKPARKEKEASLLEGDGDDDLENLLESLGEED